MILSIFHPKPNEWNGKLAGLLACLNRRPSRSDLEQWHGVTGFLVRLTATGIAPESKPDFPFNECCGYNFQPEYITKILIAIDQYN